MVISSPTNPQVKDVVRLRTARARRASRRFIIEGRRETARAIEAGTAIETIYLCPELGPGPANAAGVETVEVTRQVFEKMSIRQGPDGVIAVARTWSLDLEALAVPTTGLVLVAVGIEKPGNLGAMIRTADGAGVDGLVVADPRCDPFAPNSVRASQGALFTLPIGAATSPEVVDWLGVRGVPVYPATPHGGAPFWAPDYGDGAAFVIGPEDEGLDESWLAVGRPVTLPMMGSGDSLNASVTAGILLYAAVAARSRG